MIKIDEKVCKQLIEKALEMRKFSYAPYSNFLVGAALLTSDGEVYGGCNIENAAYPSGNCAERTAFCKAVSEGKREFSAIAIMGAAKGSDSFEVCAPCGMCRQLMMEFCVPGSFYIILGKSADDYTTYTLAELMPLGFGPDNLK